MIPCTGYYFIDFIQRTTVYVITYSTVRVFNVFYGFKTFFFVNKSVSCF